jgi:predicted transcriptional regulator
MMELGIMSDQAIIALVGLVGSALSGVMYYLVGGIKAALKESTGDLAKKIDSFVAELSKVKEVVAVKSTVMEYIQSDIASVKKHCWHCQHDKKKDKDL